MAQLYAYKPIDLSRDAIRLLRLLRDSDHTSSIRCEIFEAFVNDEERLPYEALSYTWGAGVNESSPSITLDGQKVSVTHNLFDALYHLRRSDSDRILWVDALCINQQDHREKGHQVGQMRETYEKAEMVLIWLGTSTLDTEELMDWINDVARALGRSSWLDKPLHELKLILPPRILSLGNEGLRKQQAFDHLTKRAWFRRIWIVQEVTVAKTARIVCGWRSCSSKIFSLIPSLLDIKLTYQAAAVIEMMPGWMRRQSSASQDRRLTTLLRRFQHNDSSLPHDRVYALLGLTSDAREFPVDYEIPFHQVAVNLAIFLATGQVKHPMSHGQFKVSFWDVLEGPSSQEEFFNFLMPFVLPHHEETFLIFLIKSAALSQRYILLHMVAARPEFDHATHELMSNPSLHWDAPSLDSDELSKAINTVLPQGGRVQFKTFLLKRLAWCEDFVVDPTFSRIITRALARIDDHPLFRTTPGNQKRTLADMENDTPASRFRGAIKKMRREPRDSRGPRLWL